MTVTEILNRWWASREGSEPQGEVHDTVIDFGSGNTLAYVTVLDTDVTLRSVITAKFTSNLDEIAEKTITIKESSRIVGTSYTLIGIAPQGAWGTYNVRSVLNGA
jgi:hypothetical protein